MFTSRRKRLNQWRGAALVLCGAALAPAAFAYGVGLWLDYSDAPAPSDLMVVLAGDVSRPFYAADLFKQGLAPEIWLSRPIRSQADAMAIGIGALRPEEDVNRDILVKRGVPSKRIHLYGTDVQSTFNEALAFSIAARTRGKKVLVITSRYHARRASWIFHRALKGASVRVVASPYEVFTRRWWKDRLLAQDAVLEIAKTLFYLSGGKFLSPVTG